jgi:hypothetical protein
MRQDRPDLVHQYEAEVAKADLLRRALTAGPFPGMGTGDPDVYKAFCWRFWHLLSARTGRIGVVLPRSAWCAKGSNAFRLAVFAAGAAEIAFVVNNGGWVFPGVHQQYTVGLSTLRKGAAPEARTVSLRGPFRSAERFAAGHNNPPSPSRPPTFSAGPTRAPCRFCPPRNRLRFSLNSARPRAWTSTMAARGALGRTRNSTPQTTSP